ncbi:J domain-containing protein [Cellulomonas sp. ACRRI]|uniref:J domain-containing protein n=1 Tax=Cellulomonas sp. ACRRI TaxID=2918188 RepID=UPI001EF19E72|nr:J domain-containing protein [Cellulomonas sp. ACRRI]MCG7286382.1 J domain-containing protein [Cellulomonas sp. ACRRI]
MGPTHYDVLGVGRDASDVEVRRAYHSGARATHPDQNPNAHESLFVLIRRAYEVLSDPTKRARYDAFLAGSIATRHNQPGTSASDREHAERSSPTYSAAAAPPPAKDDPGRTAPTAEVAPVRRWPRSGLIAGGVGLTVLLAFAVVPATRDAYGSILWIQFVGLAVATWIAVRGRPVGAYSIAGLHLAFIATAILVGTLDGHVDEAWMLVAQSLALGAFVFGAVRVRSRMPPAVRKGARVADGVPRYGSPGHTWKRLGCLRWIVAFVLASSVAALPAALIAEPVIWLTHMQQGPATTVRFGTLMVCLALCLWGASWTYGRIARKPAFWCQSCGVRTDPQFRVCRACGRVKPPA